MSHRSWRARLILISLAALTLLGAVATAGSAFVLLQLGRIERHEIADVLTSAPQQPVTAADVLVSQLATAPANPDGDTLRDAADGAGGSISGEGAGAQREAEPSPQEDNAADPSTGQPVLPSGPPGENYLLVGTDSTLGLAGRRSAAQ